MSPNTRQGCVQSKQQAGPSVAARAGTGGPDKPGHDGKAPVTLNADWCELPGADARAGNVFVSGVAGTSPGTATLAAVPGGATGSSGTLSGSVVRCPIAGRSIAGSAAS